MSMHQTRFKRTLQKRPALDTAACITLCWAPRQRCLEVGGPRAADITGHYPFDVDAAEALRPAVDAICALHGSVRSWLMIIAGFGV